MHHSNTRETTNRERVEQVMSTGEVGSEARSRWVATSRPRDANAQTGRSFPFTNSREPWHWVVLPLFLVMDFRANCFHPSDV